MNMNSYPALAAGLAGRKPPRPTLGWHLRRAALWLPDLVIWGPRYLWQLREFRRRGATVANVLAGRRQTMPYRVLAQANAAMLRTMRKIDEGTDLVPLVEIDVGAE